MAADAIIVGGGSGLRFGQKKQFFSLGGIPLIKRAVDCFDRHAGVERLIVVVPRSDLEITGSILEGMSKPLLLSAGGRTRQESVASGLKLCRTEGLILIHDGVRPFVTDVLISRLLAAVEGFDACIPGLAVSNTLKEVDGDLVVRTVPREKLFSVQTPQCFRAEVIIRAHAQASVQGYLEATDDSALVENLGGSVRLVEGDPYNMKITVAEDIEVAEAILRCRTESV
jgi:2-C-methyl-D-erythritol 4-phosphate cytidylyltransferase